MEKINDRKVNIVQSVGLFYKNYFNFTGRSSRGAYWWWILAATIIGLILEFCDAKTGIYLYSNEINETNIGITSVIFALINFIPGIGLAARRLHDIGRSGWWQLIPLTIIGIIPFVYWICKKGDAGANKYGDDLEAGR